jgi:hypothetical protein
MDAKKVPAESSYGHTLDSDSDEFLIASTNAIHAVESKNSMTAKFIFRFLTFLLSHYYESQPEI